MPQLSQIGEIYASQAFWLAIVFALIYFGIGKAMVPKIERVMENRSARISGDLAAAEAARHTMKADEEAYARSLDAGRAQAVHLTGDAKAQAATASEVRVKAADAAAEARATEAAVRIADTKRSALAEIEGATADAVTQIVAKLSGVTVDRAVAEQKVKAELAHG